MKSEKKLLIALNLLVLAIESHIPTNHRDKKTTMPGMQVASTPSMIDVDKSARFKTLIEGMSPLVRRHENHAPSI